MDGWPRVPPQTLTLKKSGFGGLPSHAATATCLLPRTRTWLYAGLLTTLPARPACRLAWCEPVVLQVSAPGALRLTEENDSLTPVPGHQADGGHAPTGLAPGARITRRVPGRYLPGTREVPGWRNPQASGRFDLAEGRPAGLGGRRPGGAGPLPGRREVDGRSTTGPRQVTGRYMDLLADSRGAPREKHSGDRICVSGGFLPRGHLGCRPLLPLIPAAGQAEGKARRPGPARPWPSWSGVVRWSRPGPGCCSARPGAGSGGACRSSAGPGRGR